MGLFSKSPKQKETVERVKDNAREPLQITESKNVFFPIKTKEELEEKKKNLGKDQIIRESSEGNSSYYTLTRMDD